MDFTYLKKTDANLAKLAKNRGTTRKAKGEIKRRKLVGYWDGTAATKWKLEPEYKAEVNDDQA